ncbi:MAG TPA: iron ABC transporter substrate-binding protein, partial [Spirochaetia bacterium]|nr:iron ABC transporter substrate-binding protein [Spirochaetia bacterium]
MKRFIIIITAFLLPLLLAIACGGDAPTARTTTIIDGLGRSVTVPMNPSRIVGAGPGCLRYLVYLQVQENVIAVEAAEKQTPPVEPRPYALAVPRFTRLPSFGDPSTADGAERLRSLKPAPLVIFLTYPGAGVDADSLQE